MKLCFPDGTSAEIEAEPGTSLSTAAAKAGIRPKNPTCLGHGRCGVCLVGVADGFESLSPPSEAESRVLRILGATPSQRLACQALVKHGTP
jgi:adenylate cyclase